MAEDGVETEPVILDFDWSGLANEFDGHTYPYRSHVVASVGVDFPDAKADVQDRVVHKLVEIVGHMGQVLGFQNLPVLIIDVTLPKGRGYYVGEAIVKSVDDDSSVSLIGVSKEDVGDMIYGYGFHPRSREYLSALSDCRLSFVIAHEMGHHWIAMNYPDIHLRSTEAEVQREQGNFEKYDLDQGEGIARTIAKARVLEEWRLLTQRTDTEQQYMQGWGEYIDNLDRGWH